MTAGSISNQHGPSVWRSQICKKKSFLKLQISTFQEMIFNPLKFFLSNGTNIRGFEIVLITQKFFFVKKCIFFIFNIWITISNHHVFRMFSKLAWFLNMHDCFGILASYIKYFDFFFPTKIHPPIFRHFADCPIWI